MKQTKQTVIGIGIQNNSGGYFIQNEDVNVYVAVEGVNRADAQTRFGRIVAPHSVFCSCCGMRWGGLSFDGWPAPERLLTLEDFEETDDEEKADCVLHLLNGEKIMCMYKGDEE